MQTAQRVLGAAPELWRAPRYGSSGRVAEFGRREVIVIQCFGFVGPAQRAVLQSARPSAAALTMIVAILHTSALAFAEEAKTPEAAEPAEAAKKTKDLDADAEAPTQPNRPMLMTAFGGSLGVAAVGGLTGAQAAASLKAGSGKTSATDVLARFGTLSFGPFRVEALTETFDTLVPQIVLDGKPAVASMARTGFAAAGLRTQWGSNSTLHGTSLTDLRECLKHLENKRSSGTSFQQAIWDLQASDSKGKPCADVNTIGTWQLMLGGRVLARGTNADIKPGEFSNGQAEFGVRYDRDPIGAREWGLSFYGGLGGTIWNEVDSAEGDVTTRAIAAREARLVLGFELRGARSREAAAKAVGVYAGLSNMWWTNDFAPNRPNDVYLRQWEGGLYASGAWTDFSGRVMVSAVLPYGPDSQPIFALIVAPFGSGNPVEPSANRAEPGSNAPPDAPKPESTVSLPAPPTRAVDNK